MKLNQKSEVKKQKRGFIALSSMLVILVVIVVIGTSVSLLSVSNIQLSLSHAQSIESLVLVESCVEEALLQLNETDNIPTTITLPEITCSVTINSHSGIDWDFTVSGQSNTHEATINITATRGSTIEITNWEIL